MICVECPWCAGAAAIEVSDGEEFSCAGCAIRVEIASERVTDLSDRVTLAA